MTTEKSLAISLPIAAQPLVSVPSVNELEAYSKMAKFLFESRLYPEIDSPAKAVVLMMTAQSMGLHPMDAIRGIDIIKGRPALKPQFLGALIIRAGHPVYDVAERSATACRILFYRREKPQKATEVTFTIEEAKAAGLAGRDGAWKNFTADMLFNRCLARGARQCYPEIFFNTYIPEELQNEPTTSPTPMRVISGEPVDVTTGEIVETKPAPKLAEPKPIIPTAELIERQRANAAIRSLTGVTTWTEKGWHALTNDKFEQAALELTDMEINELKKELHINSFVEAIKPKFPDAKKQGQFSAALHYIWHNLPQLTGYKKLELPDSDPAAAGNEAAEVEPF